MKVDMIALFGAVLVGVGGCASNVAYEGKYAPSEGWRKGTVVQKGPASSITKFSFRDCRGAPADVVSGSEYAAVRFLRNGRIHHRIARLSADTQLQVGDKVYVNIEDCDAPVPKRSS